MAGTPRQRGGELVGLAVLVAFMVAGGAVGFYAGRTTAPAAATSAAGPSPASTVTVTAEPDPERTAQPRQCREQARAAMAVALIRDGNLDALPKLPDRSLGIAACRGLSTRQLDDIAAQLQVDLAPYLLAAAARQAGTPSP